MNRRLVIRSGGGARGVQTHCGSLRAMHELGLYSDTVSGTSAGGLASLIDACDMDIRATTALVAALTSADVKDERKGWRLQSMLSKFLKVPLAPPSIHKDGNIKATIRRILPKHRNQLKKPAFVWGVDRDTWQRINLCDPELDLDIHTMALATMSAPPFLPAVRLGTKGPHIYDGGIRFNLPLIDTWQEYEEVWIFVASSRDPGRFDDSIIGNTVQAMKIMMWDQTGDPLEDPEIVAAWLAGRVHIVEFPRPKTPVGIFDFDDGAMEQGYQATKEYIERVYSRRVLLSGET